MVNIISLFWITLIVNFLYRLSLRNNQFEDTPIQLIGEGYMEEVTIDNVRGQVEWINEEELIPCDSNEEISGKG